MLIVYVIGASRRYVYQVRLISLVFDYKVEGGKEDSLPSLPTIQLLNSYKAPQVIIVGKYLNYIRYAFEVVVVLLKALYNRKEFSIIYLVVILYRD